MKKTALIFIVVFLVSLSLSAGDSLVKVGNWYLGPVKNWQTTLYGYEMRSGSGDLITNNTRLIMRTGDRSDWAYECLERCFDLLEQHKRWPDEIDDLIPDDRQCNTRLCSFANKMRFKYSKALNEWRVKKGKEKKRILLKARSQNDMTRDPYIDAIACAIDMNQLDFIEISIPRYLYRPTTWKWHKYLKDPTEKRFKRWERAERFSAMFDQKDFVHELKQQRKEAVDQILILTGAVNFLVQDKKASNLESDVYTTEPVRLPGQMHQRFLEVQARADAEEGFELKLNTVTGEITFLKQPEAAEWVFIPEVIYDDFPTSLERMLRLWYPSNEPTLIDWWAY